MAAKKSKSKPSTRKGKTKTAAKKAPKTAKTTAAKKKPAKKTAATARKKAAVQKPAAKKKVTKKAAPVKKKAVKKKVVKKTANKKVASKTKKKAVVKATTVAKKKATAKPAKKATKTATTKTAAKKAAAKKPTKPSAGKAVAPKKAAAPKRKVVKNSHTPGFIKKQHQRLLDLRDELVDAMSGMTRDTIRNAPEGSEASGSGQHQGDAGSDAYDRDFALSVLAKEQDALYEIEQALRRVENGTYGICEMSLNKIPQMRLEAIPFARLTVDCQAQWEKEYGNRRFRPSEELGFSGGNELDSDDSASVSLDDDD